MQSAVQERVANDDLQLLGGSPGGGGRQGR